MKTNKLFLSLLASSTVFTLGSQTSQASASTWHQGVPSFVTNHEEWISGYSHIKESDHGYMRYVLFFTKNNFSENTTNGYSTMIYNNKKQQVDEGDAEGIVTKPVYKKIGNSTYLIKGTKYVKEQLNFQYKITKHSNNYISASIKGNYEGFHHWKKLGNFKPNNDSE